MVLNDQKEILLVKEQHRKIDRWKMPGGLVDPGEALAAAAQREVFEETGVKASFKSVLAFWQRTVSEDLSDVYCVCRLTLAGPAEITFDPNEISEATWMPLRTYLAEQSHPMLIAVLERNFGLRRAQDMDDLPEGPLVPKVELTLNQLRVSPSSAPFDTFLPDKQH